jgi:hypothetical protein
VNGQSAAFLDKSQELLDETNAIPARSVTRHTVEVLHAPRLSRATRNACGFAVKAALSVASSPSVIGTPRCIPLS